MKPNTSTCTINWNVLNFSEWEQKFKSLNRATLLQSYPYAQTMAQIHKQKPRWGVIEINGIQAGLVQILEAGLFKNLIHAIILDRGPLWFDGYNTPENIRAFFIEFNRQFPSRFARKRRIIPETDMDITSFGYTPHGDPYETIWLDVSQSPDSLRAQFLQKWRGALNKAEKQKFKLEWDSKGDHFEWLVENYEIDKLTKDYDGVSVTLLKTLAKYHLPRGELLIGRASLDGKPVAGILILCHGSAATYQIGFTTPQGREHNAHHLLLWQAIGVLKFKKIRDFDLGGINDKSAKGVKKFKQGMGGQTVSLGRIYT